MSRRWVRVVVMASAWVAACLSGGLHVHADVSRQHVHVRWAPPVAEGDRLGLERTFGLIEAQPQPDRTWTYLLSDRSRRNIAALVQDPSVEDTAHIDRSAFRIQLDRPDLPRWAAALAETEQLDTLALVFGIIALIATWRCRLDIGGAWKAAVETARPPVLALGSALRGLWRGAAGATLIILRAVGRRKTACLRVTAVAAGALAFGALFCWPLVRRLGQIGAWNDWDQYLTLHWVPYQTVRQFGEIPFWNPYVCGGMPMLGNPQSRWLSPFFLLHLMYGPEYGLQLEMIAHISLAWLGALLLGRAAGLSWVASVAPAVIFAGCSYFYLHLAEGHATWVAFAYMPAILAAAAANRHVVAGVGLALAIGEGGVYQVPYTGLALALLALHRTFAKGSVAPLAGLGLSAIIAACVAAPKLLLVQPLLSRYPRVVESEETVSLALLTRALLSPEQDLLTVVPGVLGFHEYGAYVGLIAMTLALYGALGPTRRTVPWIALLGVGLALSLGGTLGGDYSPWALLHRLPVFASLRVPSRFLIVAVLAIGMLAGFGIDRLLSRRGGWRLAMAVGLLVIVTVDLARVGPPQLRYVFYTEEMTFEPSASFVQLKLDTHKQMYATAQANMGALNCYEPLTPVVAPRGVNEPNYRGEQYLLRGGTVRLVEWSPNRLAFLVSSSDPNVLVVNYNYDPFWQVLSGRGDTFDHDGLLGVSIPAGTQPLVLAYRSQRFAMGVLLAVAALTVAGVRALRRRSNRPADRPSDVDHALRPPAVGPMTHL